MNDTRAQHTHVPSASRGILFGLLFATVFYTILGMGLYWLTH